MKCYGQHKELQGKRLTNHVILFSGKLYSYIFQNLREKEDVSRCQKIYAKKIRYNLFLTESCLERTLRHKFSFNHTEEFVGLVSMKS